MNRPIAAGVLVTLASTAAVASPAVTLTDANTEANPLTYTAGPFVVGTANVGCAPTLCDDTPLTIAVSPAAASTMRVVAQIGWGIPTGSDFDLFILQNGNVFAASAGTADPEITRFSVQNGDYVVHVDSYQPLGNSFTATIYLEPLTSSNAAPTGIAPSYDTFAPPDNAAQGGEPSIGANWNTGSVVVGNSNQAYFVNFDDSTAPATATWANRPPTTNLVSFDPILFTDRETGRTVVSQLVSDVVLFSTGCSLSSYTDDDGHTWVPSEGCGPPAGADHQAVGGGPYHAPMSNLGPIYAHAVYYCAQAVGRVLADATCSRSDDGGLTYGPGVVVYTSECGGKHGHPRVAPDGTVYLPDESCADPNGLHQGMAISTDNGASWHYSSIPESLPGQSDPSVATGLNDTGKPDGQASNTVYFGYCDGDGLPKVAVSHDQGATWINVFNVGAAANIQNCVFPEMIAGDDDRAALFFLGTSTPGNFQGADFTGEWHAYVATTLDGGATWGLSDATPKDPVQIGCIWLSGGGNACRNLLDFNDITVDSEGRPVFVFADGCVPPDCAVGATPDKSRTAVDSIGRQSGGPRLFAQFDPPVEIPPVTPPTTPPPATASSDARFGGAMEFEVLIALLMLGGLRNGRRARK